MRRGYKKGEDGQLYVWKSNHLVPFNYHESYKITHQTRSLVSRATAQRGYRKLDEVCLGILLDEALDYFIGKMDWNPGGYEHVPTKQLHFSSTKEGAMKLREILSRDNLVDFLLRIYLESLPDETANLRDNL